MAVTLSGSTTYVRQAAASQHSSSVPVLCAVLTSMCALPAPAAVNDVCSENRLPLASGKK